MSVFAMADSMYAGDYLLDTEVKQESQDEGMCRSVPIPPRRVAELADLRDFTSDLDVSQEATQMFSNMQGFKFAYEDSMPKTECFKMDDEDIFQVDKADLIQGPTLAELNANPDTLLDDLNFDDLLLPEESSFCLHIGGAMVHSMANSPALRLQPSLTPLASPATPSHMNTYGNESAPSSPYDVYARSQTAFSPSSQHSSASSSFVQPPHTSNLQELMLRMESYGGEAVLGQSVPASAVLPAPRSKPHSAAQLSSSAPTHLTMDQIWQRREPRKHLLSTSSIAEAGSVSSLSGGLLSPEACELSQEEDEKEAETDDDSDRDEDWSSDESDVNESAESKQARANAKKERYFWQYNVQAKGPKGQRLVMKSKLEDPHILNMVTDPVFSPSCSVRGIKHSGKARKGDGNDLTPNPRKLFVIGKELDNLGRIINDMTPVSELPFNVRPKTRKEKNKLASRACRLKKKAQHEANKLKLYGLEKEHKRLLSGIEQVKNIITNRVTNPQPEPADWSSHVQSVVGNATEIKIAGSTSEFVNMILDNVKAGQNNGGLTDV